MGTFWMILITIALPSLLYWGVRKLPAGPFYQATLFIGFVGFAAAMWLLFKARDATGWDGLGYFLFAAPLYLAAVTVIAAHLWRFLSDRFLPPSSGLYRQLSAWIFFVLCLGVAFWHLTSY